MVEFRKFVEDIFNSGDPGVRTWFLVRNNYLPFIMSGMFLIFSTHLGPAIMKNRKPFNLRIPMIVFNFSLVLIYSVCLLIDSWSMQYIGMEKICQEGKLLKGDIMYLVFFVLRKKGELITFLHLVHHSLVPILYWILFRTERSATTCILGSLNTLEHIVMYSYYGLAAMGPSVRKYLWWKKYVTLFQMIQFILMIVFMTVVAPLLGCKIGFFTYAIYTTAPLAFLYLFYKMYVEKFHLKKQR